MHLEYSKTIGGFDLVFDTDQTTDQSLKDAVIISLFCWKRAAPEEVVNDENYGWWARDFGSKLWLSRRAKTTPDLIGKLKKTIEESLSWMVEDGVADNIKVTVAKNPSDPSVIGSEIVVSKNNKTTVVRFANLWDAV